MESAYDEFWSGVGIDKTMAVDIAKNILIRKAKTVSKLTITVCSRALLTSLWS